MASSWVALGAPIEEQGRFRDHSDTIDELLELLLVHLYYLPLVHKEKTIPSNEDGLIVFLFNLSRSAQTLPKYQGTPGGDTLRLFATDHPAHRNRLRRSLR